MVLPAYAGMIPAKCTDADDRKSAPRVCGDDPIISELLGNFRRCSPRMRG